VRRARVPEIVQPPGTNPGLLPECAEPVRQHDQAESSDHDWAIRQ
jgi:hypothetical protein